MAVFRTKSGYDVQVDDADLAVVRQFTWLVTLQGRITKKPRVYTQIGGRKRKKRVYLARLLMWEPPCQVDHKNGDTLDNRRSTNLRLATPIQNSQNQQSTGRGTSKFKGVSLHKTRHGLPIRGKPWRASIRVDGKKSYLGFYADEAAAAVAYDDAARKFYGEFACLNFPDRRVASNG
jgi:HNH endonuclease